MLCPLYMAEISPPEFRGALMAMEQFSIVLGCVLGFWAGFFTREGMSLPSPFHGTAGLYVSDHLFLTYSTSVQYKTNVRITTMILQHRPIVSCRVPVLFWNTDFVAFPCSSAIPSCTRFRASDFLSPTKKKVDGSASWRIPLGVQLIPGVVLAIGCVFLPPSPRLLVAQGRNGEALRTLAKLRLRSEHEAQDDPLLQVRRSVFIASLSLRCIYFLAPMLPHSISIFLSLSRPSSYILFLFGSPMFICFVSRPFTRLVVLPAILIRSA